MAAEANQSDDRDADVGVDRELTSDGGRVSSGQAEAIRSRDRDVRDDVVEALREVEGDVSGDAPRVDGEHLADLDEAIDELIAFSRDLHDLEPKGGDDERD